MPTGGTPDISRTYVAISSSDWPLQVCILPVALPRSDERPAYIGSEHTEGIPGRTIHCTSNKQKGYSIVSVYIHGITTDIQT